MLTLQNVTIHLQNFGTIVGVFLVGNDRGAIERRYYSFYNHEATGGELEWWSDTCALFWIYSTPSISAMEKLILALARGALAEMLNDGHTKGSNPWPHACETAMARFNQIDHVTWFQPQVRLEMYDVGDSVIAEKGTGNFDDDVLGSVVMRNGSASLDLLKIKQGKETDETESVGQDV